MEEAGDFPDQWPAPAEGNGEAQAGGSAVVAAPEEGAAGCGIRGGCRGCRSGGIRGGTGADAAGM